MTKHSVTFSSFWTRHSRTTRGRVRALGRCSESKTHTPSAKKDGGRAHPRSSLEQHVACPERSRRDEGYPRPFTVFDYGLTSPSTPLRLTAFRHNDGGQVGGSLRVAQDVKPALRLSRFFLRKTRQHRHPERSADDSQSARSRRMYKAGSAQSSLSAILCGGGGVCS